MSTKVTRRQKTNPKKRSVSEILIDTDGRLFVTNLTGDLLEVLKACVDSPEVAKRYAEFARSKSARRAKRGA